MITFTEFMAVLEDYRSPTVFVIYNKTTRAVLGSAKRFDAAKERAKQIRQQRGLKFDDVSFMSQGKFYGGRSKQSPGRRIEYARNINPSKGRRFRGVWDAQGNFADLD